MTTNPTPSNRDREIADDLVELATRQSFNEMRDAIAAALAQRAAEVQEACAKVAEKSFYMREFAPGCDVMVSMDRDDIAAAIRSRKDD